MIQKLKLEGHTGKRWCVPSAVALLSGKPLIETTRRLAEIRASKIAEVEGCWMEEAVLALHDYGLKCQPVDIIGRYPDLTCGPTLKRYMAERPAFPERCLPTLIGVHGHALVGHFDMLFDNGVPTGKPFMKFPQIGRLVQEVWVVTELMG